MSIQDDIYDTEEALGNCVTSADDLTTFNRILAYLFELEKDVSELRKENITLKAAIQIVNDKQPQKQPRRR